MLVGCVAFVAGLLGAADFCRGQERADRITIVAFGDSTTAPRKVNGQALTVYADILAKALPARGMDAVVINAGVGGNTTADAKARLKKDVLNRNPNLVILQFGINDSAIDVWKKPPAQGPRVAYDRYEKNLESFIDTLRKHKADVILMTPNPLRWTDSLKKRYGKPPYDPDDPEGFNLLLKKYAEGVRRIARGKKVQLVDVWAAFAAYDKVEGQSTDDLLLDGIHPNAKGHRLIADLLIKRIVTTKRAAKTGPKS